MVNRGRRAAASAAARPGHRLWLAAALLVAEACYLSHGIGEVDAGLADAALDASPELDAAPKFDAALGCAPAGTYLTPARLVAVTPEGCVEPPSEPLPMVFPFDGSFDPSCLVEPNGVRQIDDCLWSIDCVPAPIITDFGVEIEGTLGMGPDGVYGELRTTAFDIGGTCTYTLELGEVRSERM